MIRLHAHTWKDEQRLLKWLERAPVAERIGEALDEFRRGMTA